jgi:carbon-monoxide dehydrogenase small subunit
MTKVAVQFTLNDEEQNEFIDSGSTLLSVLRGKLGLYSTKAGCHQGTCGACTVIIDGEPRLSCLTLAQRCAGRKISTIEGLTRDGALHPLQQTFMEGFAAQCGFCTPGMIVTAHWFLEQHPDATREELRAALAGNICRCTGYTKILDALEAYRDQQRELASGN